MREWKKSALMLAIPGSCISYWFGLVMKTRLQVVTVIAVRGVVLPGCNEVVHAIMASPISFYG